MSAALKKLIQMAWDLEKNSRDGQWPLGLYTEFENALRTFPRNEISNWARHLSPQMTVRHFQSLIVPLERELQKNPSDQDFLVTTADRVESSRKTWPLQIALDHWRSAFNVGSIFRTADGLGVEKIHLWGYTPTPESTAVQKTALGSHTSVPWSSTAMTSKGLQQLKAEGFHLIAFETSPSSIDLEKPFPRQKTVLVFGNERFGMNPEDIKLCNEVRSIPMNGKKNSLNVGVCAALAIYEWKRQWIING